MENRASISDRDRFPSFQKWPHRLWGPFHGGEAAVVCSRELACTKVKNAWSYTSILTFAFMGRCLITRTDSCTFYQSITFWDKVRNLALSKKWLQSFCLLSVNDMKNICTCMTAKLYNVLITNIYTGCNRRNGPDFGRVFLRSNYTDITQNTYIQSWTVNRDIGQRKEWASLVSAYCTRFHDVILPSPWTTFLC
jgi:hypothetical protein